jgi:CHAT domain-containing protein
LVNTAEILVNRAPRQKRIEVERSALFDTLSHAQLVLSVTRLPQGIDKEVPKRGKQQEETRGLEDQLKQSQADLVKAQHALEQLDWLIQPVATTLDELQDKAKRAQTIVKTALKIPARVLPFRKSRWNVRKQSCSFRNRRPYYNEIH